MGREKDSRKRKHSHRSRHDSSDNSSSSDYSSDYSSSEESSYDSESSVEVKKKRRTSSEGRKRKEKVSDSKKSKKKHKKEVKKKNKKKPKIVEISEDDYYLKSAEFRTWLSKERGTYFSELTSEEARKLFKKFVVKWNKGTLDKMYYDGIQSSAVAHGTQSSYKWKFSSSVDSGELRTVRDSVSQWSSEGSEVRAAAGPSTRGVIGPSAGPTIGPIRGPQESVYDREERREGEVARLKKDRREHRKHQQMGQWSRGTCTAVDSAHMKQVLDELLPKATGREAKVEKKRVRAEERRAREYSPDLPDRTIMGPSHSIQSRIQKIQDKREKKATSAVQKISDYRAKEKARMEAIMEMARANKKEGAMW